MGMESHEGKQMGGGLRGRPRLVAAATALVSALALAAPGVAGAALFSRSAPAPARAPISLTITQNTAMIVDVSSTPSLLAETVSWSDVSWSDAFLTE
jgi:hypothetical protein